MTAVVALISSPFRRTCRRADEWATFNETSKTTGGSGNRKMSVKIMILCFELQICGAEEITFLSRLLTPLVSGKVWTKVTAVWT